MVNHSSIKYISSLLNNPETITSGDQSSIALFRQTFPYFVPVRYLAAVENNKNAQYAPSMLSEIQPYVGDWILFCDFLEAGAKTKKADGADSVSRVLDKKKVDVSQQRSEPEIPKPNILINTPIAQPAAETTKQPHAPAVPTPAAKKTADHTTHKTAAPALNKEDIPFIKIEDTPQIPGFADLISNDASTAMTEAPEQPQADNVTAQQQAETLQAVSEQQEPAATEQQIKEDTVNAADIKPASINIVPEPVDVPTAVIAEQVITTPEEPETPVAASQASATAEPEAIKSEQGPEKQATEPVTENVEIHGPAAGSTITESIFNAPEENITSVDLQQQLPADEINVTDTVPNETPFSPYTDVEESDDELIAPIYTQDYFLQQGEKVSEELPEEIDELIDKGGEEDDEDKSLMVMMSFSEWLLHFKNTGEKQQEEKKDQKALKTMWQKEKLAAAIEEENEEIPENVFQMAVNSITKEEDLASEPLAEIYIKQGRYDQAVEMYRKLSLRNPQKSTYFARKIEEILKEKS